MDVGTGRDGSPDMDCQGIAATVLALVALMPTIPCRTAMCPEHGQCKLLRTCHDNHGHGRSEQRDRQQRQAACRHKPLKSRKQAIASIRRKRIIAAGAPNLSDLAVNLSAVMASEAAGPCLPSLLGARVVI